jgi:hypothetical protein
MVMALVEIIINGNRYGIVHLLLVYYLGFELFGRMLGCSPIIPWESGKYIAIPLLMFGIISFNKPRLSPGIWLILLSLPGVLIYIFTENFDYNNLIFNYFGLLGILLGMIYFKNLIIDKEHLIIMSRLIIMPLLSVLTYIIIASPDLEQIDFGNEANVATTGGFGSNQVSTLLGIGFFIPLILYIMNFRLFPQNYLNLLIIFLFLLRGFLTFSRGGIYVPTIATLLPFIVFKKNIPVHKYFRYLILGILIFGGIFIYSNQLTNNALKKRYSIEEEEKNNMTRDEVINEYTTGRFNILKNDLEIWSKHPVWGIGVGMSKYYHKGGRTAHIELSRLLAEHGLMGLIIAIFLFIVIPIREVLRRKDLMEKLWSSALFIIAILSTFHSATRTLVPVIFYGLAFVQIKTNVYNYTNG